MLHFDAFANKLMLSTFRLKYFRAYVHIDVVVKSSDLPSMHEDVRYQFIWCYSPKAGYENDVHKNHCKSVSVRNEIKNELLGNAWNISNAKYHIR
jgi:hypothetical protein